MLTVKGCKVRVLTTATDITATQTRQQKRTNSPSCSLERDCQPKQGSNYETTNLIAMRILIIVNFPPQTDFEGLWLVIAKPELDGEAPEAGLCLSSRNRWMLMTSPFPPTVFRFASTKFKHCDNEGRMLTRRASRSEGRWSEVLPERAGATSTKI